MSETYLGEPRFKVTSVRGGGFQVLDRPYCYEFVFEASQRRTAERIAGLLNAGNWHAAAMFIRDLERQREYDKTYHKGRA